MSDSRPLQVRASAAQQEARQRLIELFRNCPIPHDQLMTNLPLFIRSSALAKVLYIDELYRLITDIPGVIIEFGSWWGANLVLFENLRAVHEPYNHQRKVIGFDTFTGYSVPGEQDGNDVLVANGAYSTGETYIKYLEELLHYHETENTLPHIQKFQLVGGDATRTIGEYFKAHPETIVALAYFDMQLYEPTKACLEAIKPHLIQGSVIAMDELAASEFPGETLAYREAIGLERFRLSRSRYLPDRCYAIVS